MLRYAKLRFVGVLANPSDLADLERSMLSPYISLQWRVCAIREL